MDTHRTSFPSHYNQRCLLTSAPWRATAMKTVYSRGVLRGTNRPGTAAWPARQSGPVAALSDLENATSPVAHGVSIGRGLPQWCADRHDHGQGWVAFLQDGRDVVHGVETAERITPVA